MRPTTLSTTQRVDPHVSMQQWCVPHNIKIKEKSRALFITYIMVCHISGHSTVCSKLCIIAHCGFHWVKGSVTRELFLCYDVIIIFCAPTSSWYIQVLVTVTFASIPSWQMKGTSWLFSSRWWKLPRLALVLNRYLSNRPKEISKILVGSTFSKPASTEIFNILSNICRISSWKHHTAIIIACSLWIRLLLIK